MNKKMLFAVTFSVFSAVAVGVASKNGTLSMRRALDCAHEGYHYSAKEANFTENGLHEWWTCCKCHQTFDALSVLDNEGQWIDRDFAESEGGVPNAISEWEVLAPCALTDFKGTAVTDPSNINYLGGYNYSTLVKGDGLKGYHFLPINVEEYDEIKFSAISIDGGWLEIYNPGESSHIMDDKANWHEVSWIREGSSFRLYFDGVWVNETMPADDYLNDFLSDHLTVKIASGKSYCFSEVLAKRSSTHNSEKAVVNNVPVSNGVWNAETKTSVSNVSAWKTLVAFNNINTEIYDYLNFYIRSTTATYFSVGTSYVETKFATNVWNCVQLVKATDGTWAAFGNNKLMSSGLDLDYLSALKLSSNGKNDFEISQLFGHIASGVSVVTEKAISNAVLGDNGTYTWTSTGHYAEKPFADVNLTPYESLHLYMMPTATGGYISLTVNSKQVKDKGMNVVRYWSFDFIRNSTDSSKWDIIFNGSVIHSSVAISNLNEVSFGANSTIKGVPVIVTSIYGFVKETSLVSSKIVSQSVLEGEAGSSTRFTAQDSRLTTSYKWGAGNGAHDLCVDIDITDKEYLVFYAYDKSTLNYYYGKSSDEADHIGATSASNSLVKFEFIKGASGWQIFVNGSAKKVPINTNSFADLISFNDWSNENSFFSELYGF